jgi:hypothetical protein
MGLPNWPGFGGVLTQCLNLLRSAVSSSGFFARNAAAMKMSSAPGARLRA